MTEMNCSTPLTLRQKERFDMMALVDLTQRGGVPPRIGDVAMTPAPCYAWTVRAWYTTPMPATVITNTIKMTLCAESAVAACMELQRHISAVVQAAFSVAPTITRIGAELEAQA